MKAEVCAFLDLLTCQIAVWFDLSITRFSAISDCTVILVEVRDCSSGDIVRSKSYLLSCDVPSDTRNRSCIPLILK